jgi:hypothetical protein
VPLARIERQVQSPRPHIGARDELGQAIVSPSRGSFKFADSMGCRDMGTSIRVCATTASC